MLPQVFFPALSVCGSKDGVLSSKKENHVSFRAMNNHVQNGAMRTIYVFNAFDEMAERVSRMKLKTDSQVVIFAEMKDYIDKEEGVKKQSFTITKIDFLITKPRETKSTQEENKETSKGNSKQSSKSEMQQNQPEKVETNTAKKSTTSNGTIDIDEFARMFGE
ncbi:MAG: hypothetical protein UHN47_03445 [Lachnospiraceae bacterium]|nr:hypothetical protein [Lachnospiraceae bacterium]